jgi:RNA polymerase sigma factor (sigma-70 family)
MAVVISDRLLESSDRLLDAEPDEHLVSLVQTGHEAAFAAIVRRYERELQGHARRLSSDGRGEDLVQQAFLNAFSALHNGSEVRHLRGWLHQILRNEVTRAPVPIEAPLEATVACGETLEDTVARRAIAHAALAELSALPDRQRAALLGTAVFGFPRAHVARTMGLSEGAVRQLVHRARLRLRQAASALIPFPLVKFFGAARSGVDATPDAALGAGPAVSAAASGGLAVKVGALLTSGLLATGIAVTHSASSHRHHAAVPAAHRAGSHRHVAGHVSPTSVGTAFAVDRVRGRDLEAISAGRDEHVRGGPGRPSANRLGRHRGSASGRGRAGGQGHDGSSSGGGGDGSAGGAPGRDGGDGSSGSPASSGSRSGSGDADGSGGRNSGSGSSGGRQSGSGSGSGSVTGSATSNSGSADGTGSADGAGSGRSSGGGGDSSSDSDASVSASSGSAGSTPSGSATATQSSGGGGSSQGGGSDQAGVASLGSDGAQGADSASGGGKENSHGSRDLSGATDSSSS